MPAALSIAFTMPILKKGYATRDVAEQTEKVSVPESEECSYSSATIA